MKHLILSLALVLTSSSGLAFTNFEDAVVTCSSENSEYDCDPSELLHKAAKRRTCDELNIYAYTTRACARAARKLGYPRFASYTDGTCWGCY